MTSKHPAAEKKLNKIYKYLTKYASIERQKIGELNPEMTDLERNVGKIHKTPRLTLVDLGVL